MESLRRANEVRFWLADQKALVKAGDTELWCALVISADARLKSVALIDFLQWLPKVGPGKARKMIREGFPFPTERTQQRRVDRLPLDTALRLASMAREMYENEAMRDAERAIAC